MNNENEEIKMYSVAVRLDEFLYEKSKDAVNKLKRSNKGSTSTFSSFIRSLLQDHFEAQGNQDLLCTRCKQDPMLSHLSDNGFKIA